MSYEKVVTGIGKIDTADIVKGYEVDEDTYVTLEPDEIDAVKLESKKTIDLTRFVDQSAIDYRYFERPYFIAPADELAGEGYVVIRDALRKSKRLGLGQVTIGGREWLVAIAPVGDGLVMEMLRYAEELRDPKDYFGDVPDAKPDAEMVDLAVELIEKRSGPFKPAEFQNHYRAALRELIQDKLKGRKVVAPHEEKMPAGNVIDLMDALRKSVGKPGRAAAADAKPQPRRTKARAKTSRRRA